MPKFLIGRGSDSFWDYEFDESLIYQQGSHKINVKEHIELLKNSPFDGHVFHLSCNASTYKPNLPWDVNGEYGMNHHTWDSRGGNFDYNWNDVRLSAKWLYKACKDSGTWENFILYQPSNGTEKTGIDNFKNWLDTTPEGATQARQAWNKVFKRAEQVSFVAGKSGCRGIFLDLETLNNVLLSAYITHGKINPAAIPTTTEIKEKLIVLGREFSHNLVVGFKDGREEGEKENNIYPRGNRFMIYLDRSFFSLYNETEYYKKEEKQNADLDMLWLWFLNGMLYSHSLGEIGVDDKAPFEVKFIDGCEQESYYAYGDTRRDRTKIGAHDKAAQLWNHGHSNTSYSPSYQDVIFSSIHLKAYVKHYQLGFIFYLLGKEDPNPDPDSPNYAGQIRTLEAAFKNSLDNSDEYMMVFYETKRDVKYEYKFCKSCFNTNDPVDQLLITCYAILQKNNKKRELKSSLALSVAGLQMFQSIKIDKSALVPTTNLIPSKCPKL